MDFQWRMGRRGVALAVMAAAIGAGGSAEALGLRALGYQPGGNVEGYVRAFPVGPSVELPDHYGPVPDGKYGRIWALTEVDGYSYDLFGDPLIAHVQSVTYNGDHEAMSVYQYAGVANDDLYKLSQVSAAIDPEAGTMKLSAYAPDGAYSTTFDDTWVTADYRDSLSFAANPGTYEGSVGVLVDFTPEATTGIHLDYNESSASFSSSYRLGDFQYTYGYSQSIQINAYYDSDLDRFVSSYTYYAGGYASVTAYDGDVYLDAWRVNTPEGEAREFRFASTPYGVRYLYEADLSGSAARLGWTTSLVAFNGGYVDATHTSTIAFALPDGVTMYSDTGLGGSIDRTVQSTAPEPSAWALLLGGFGGVGAVLRRRRGGHLALA